MVTVNEHFDSSAAVQPLKVGESLPKALGSADMMRAFHLSRATFFRLQAAGEFKPFLLPRAIGLKKYSGEKVQTFLNGRK